LCARSAAGGAGWGCAFDASALHLLAAYSNVVLPSLLFLQVVAKLVRVKDPAAATALEVAAGGRLYQVSTCAHQHVATTALQPADCHDVLGAFSMRSYTMHKVSSLHGADTQMSAQMLAAWYYVATKPCDPLCVQCCCCCSGCG
jgi:hypothetical protein